MTKTVGNTTGQSNDITVATGAGVVDSDTQRVVLASDQPVVPVSDNGGSLTVDGTITANAGTGTFAVSAAALPLPSGAATAAKQPALGTAGTASADVLTVQGRLGMTAVVVDGSAVTQPVSAASLPLPAGAATSAKQPALGTAGTASADVLTVQGKAGMTAVVVDGSAVTQPVSIATAPVLVAGSAVIGKVGIDQTTPGTTNLVALAANQSVNVAQINGVSPLMGNGASGTGAQRVTIANDSTGQVALAAGTAAIGKLGANSGVIIGDVNVVSEIPGTGATALGKAEDAAHQTGDTGVMMLGVRSDTPASTAGTTGDYQPPISDANGGLWVHQVQSTFRIEVDSASLTTSVTTYTSGDQLGSELTFAGAASVSGWGGVIVGASLLDKALKVNTGDVDLYLFKAASTPASDNAAADWSDANMANFVGVIKFATADWRTMASNAVNSQQNLSLGYGCSATSLFGALVTRSANAVFSAATDLRVVLHIVRD